MVGGDPEPAERPAVLLVDDLPANLTALASILEDMELDLVTATSGEEALRRVLERDFAAILLDVNMPGLDGIETARLIRGRDRSRSTPIVLISAHSSAETRQLGGYAAGAVDYLVKPVDPSVLRYKVWVFVELYQTTRRLDRLNAELERRVSERTAELVAANRDLEAFAYSVAHNLRSPLRALDGYAHALLEECADRLDPQAQTWLERIRANSQSMAQIVDDLLRLSRLTRRLVRREPVELAPLAAAVATPLRQAEPERQVELVVAPGLVAQADPDLVRVVLACLLENAWKFTSKHPRARVEVGGCGQGSSAVYYVRDDGAGFDPEHAAKLFQPFQRLHRADDFPGTGIGLAIVQRIVDRHGGRAWAVGAVEQGATFYFTLGETG